MPMILQGGGSSTTLPPPDSRTFLRSFFLGLFIQRKVHGQKLQGLIHLIDLKHFCLDQSCHLVIPFFYSKNRREQILDTEICALSRVVGTFFK